MAQRPRQRPRQRGTHGRARDARAWSLARSALLALALLPFPLAAVPLSAQQLVGRVVQAVTERPIPGAAIQVLDRRERVVLTALSGPDGGFTVAVPEADTVTLQVEHLGFTTTRLAAVPSQAPSAATIVRLTLEVIPMQPIGVTVTRVEKLERAGFYQRRALGVGTFIDRSAIERGPARTSGDLLRHVSGLRLISQGGVTDVQARGVANCRPGIFIDGALVSGARPTATAFNLEDLGAPTLEAVEVYSGAAAVPPQYTGSHSLCGIILFWTRRPGA